MNVGMIHEEHDCAEKILHKNPGEPLAAASQGPSDKPLECGDHLLQRPSISSQHEPKAGNHDPGPLRAGFESFSFPIDAKPGKEIITRPTLLREFLIFAEAIVGNGRGTEQGAFIFGSQCLDHIARGQDSRVIQEPLIGGIPSSKYGCTGEIEMRFCDGISSCQRPGRVVSAAKYFALPGVYGFACGA